MSKQEVVVEKRTGSRKTANKHERDSSGEENEKHVKKSREDSKDDFVNNNFWQKLIRKNSFSL